MKTLGKRALKKIMSKETGIPYQDVTTSSKYEFLGTIERLTLGGYEVTHNLMNEVIEFKSPDYKDEGYRKIAKEVKEVG